MKKPQVEVLAPASGLETIQAAIYAGADAVYTGGSKFGARAYADNLIEEQLLEAIDFVHMHGKRLYLTVNTLLKERELSEELVSYLEPFYVQGLDAVIVQDMGVFRTIRKHFPYLPVHVSTQAVVTGVDSAAWYEALGAQRIVTARELSLEEIRIIRSRTNIEIESFVHGALCYCYSGQCLFSSFIGGRSGNRGRCAQPCRLPYELTDKEGKFLGERQQKYLLSPKDMCALDLLPDVIEAGVYSLKIEGRMKRTEYAAGVSELYRKYVDLYLSRGREEYRVLPQDKQRLMDLYNRGSFHSGYYIMHGGREMMSNERPNHNGVFVGTLQRGKRGYEMKALADIHHEDVLEFRSVIDKKTKKPLELTASMDVKKENKYFLSEKYEFLLDNRKKVDVYRTKNARLLEELNTKYVKQKVPLEIKGKVWIQEGEPAAMELWLGSVRVQITGECVETACNRPADESYVRKQLEKTGGSGFVWEKLDIHIEGNGFFNVKALNTLRREGLEALKHKLTQSYRRELPCTCMQQEEAEDELIPDNQECQIYVTVETLEQLAVAMEYPHIHGVDVSIHAITLAEDSLEAGKQFCNMAKQCRDTGKRVSMILPYILREEVKKNICSVLRDVVSVLDTLVVKNIESFAFVKAEPGLAGLPVRLDYTAYAMNSSAIAQWKESGAKAVTVPVELNRMEIRELAAASSLPMELVVYGHMPMMISAQCLVKNTTGCQRKSQMLLLKDRKKHLHKVKNYCDVCYNVIYNSEPLSLLDCRDELWKLPVSIQKLQFTIETRKQMKQVLDLFQENFYHGGKEKLESFTRGHWKRGVE